MQRMARTMVFGPRGPHGFAKEMPGGLLVTFSQRPDVLQRGIRAAEGKETLEAEPVIEAAGHPVRPFPLHRLMRIPQRALFYWYRFLDSRP